MPPVEKVGFCTLCRSKCGTINLVDGDRLLSVKPNTAHPTGKAICAKGRSAPEIVHSARRLKTPLRRTHPKGADDPGFVPISWEDALGEIADRLNRYRDESGPESVAFSVTSASSAATSDSMEWIQRFVRAFGSPNTLSATEICNWHKDSAHAFTFGCGLPNPDYRNADLIILWGHNPANVWLAQSEAIGAARKRGARLVVIDPRRSESARDADAWIQIRPGTDGALALGLSRWLIANDAYDMEFVRQWTNAPYLVRDDNGRFLRASDIGIPGDDFVVWSHSEHGPKPARDGLSAATLSSRFDVRAGGSILSCRTAFECLRESVSSYDPRRVEEITTIPAEKIEALARSVADAKSVCYHGWTGVGQHLNATQTERAIATLYAITGHFDAPGGNVLLPALPVPVINSISMIPAETRKKALGLDKRPLGPPSKGAVTSTDFYDAVLTGNPYRVRALFGFGANLLVSQPAPERGRKALKALEFQVHCDLFLNPTAEFADIVLPVASPWEYEALKIGFEITPEAEGLVQLRQQMIPQQGDARSDLWIVFNLATRLGMADLFFGGDIAKGFAHLIAPLGLDLAALRSKPEGVYIPLKTDFRKYRQQAFKTETGTIEIYSELLHRHGYAAVPTFPEHTVKKRGIFPLTLFSVNNGYFCHSQHRGLNSLRRRRPEPRAQVHPDLARRKGLRAGDWMFVRTNSGTIRVRVALDDTLSPDVVACDYGWWQGAPDMGLPGFLPTAAEPIGSNFNSLVAEEFRDPISGSLPLRSLMCDVIPIDPGPSVEWRRFIVAEKSRITSDVTELVLRPADGAALAGFGPGQYIGIRSEGDIRNYSLVGPAISHPREYRIAVRHIEGGTFSSKVRHGLQIGADVESTAPRGTFILPQENEFPIVLIAGGIGITPFLSYLESLACRAKSTPEIVLHYGCRNASQQPFKERLRTLKALLPKLTIITHLSAPSEGDEFDRLGRIGAHDVASELIERRARFYLCAGEGMLRDVCKGLKHRGVPEFEIFTERFTSPVPTETLDLCARQITFARSGRTIQWSAESPLRSILSVAESEGLSLPSGCRVGQCESCSVAICSGRVHHLNVTEEVERDQCLTCQAVPVSDVVLDA